MRGARKPRLTPRGREPGPSATVLLLFEESDRRAAIVAALTEMGCEVHMACLAEDAGRIAHDVPPDIVIGLASFDRSRGALGCALARSRVPSATLRIFIDSNRPQERVLVERFDLASFSLPLEALDAWCGDVLPHLAVAHAELRSALRREQRPVSGDNLTRRPRIEVRLPTLLQDLEDALIRIDLEAARTDTEAASWLGLDPGTMRSKMRKRGIRSPRSRVPPRGGGA